MLAESRQQMTTDRTAIRRRLAVRRSSHRPPWGARKAAHHPILAPLHTRVAATLAASLAVGLSVALAKAERGRRSARERLQAQRQFALLPYEQLPDAFKRIALAQLDLALEQLQGRRGEPPNARSVHETRKALKRLRALLRLLDGTLEKEAFARENAALREIGQRLAGARDADVMLQTLDRLLERHPRKLARRRSLLELRSQLRSERDRAAARTLGDTAARARLIAELRAVRGHVASWQLPDGGAAAIAEPGLERLYRQGRKRYRRASARKGDHGLAMHQWRKRVKDLRYAAEMLERRDPARGKGSGGGKGSGRGNGSSHRKRGRGHVKPAGKRSRRLRELARRADKLGELLGEEHDLAVLAARIRQPDGPAPVRRRTRKLALKAISRRRRKLQRRALADGARLYRRRPKAFVARLRRG
jgi:CHAD domain-containing protein